MVCTIIHPSSLGLFTLYLVKKKTGDPEIPGVQILTPSVFFFTRARARIQVYGIWVRGQDPGSRAGIRTPSTSSPHLTTSMPSTRGSGAPHAPHPLLRYLNQHPNPNQPQELKRDVQSEHVSNGMENTPCTLHHTISYMIVMIPCHHYLTTCHHPCLASTYHHTTSSSHAILAHLDHGEHVHAHDDYM